MILTSLCSNTGTEDWLKPVTTRLLEGDYVALEVCQKAAGYVFNRKEAARLKGRPVVVLDFMEYAWNTSWKNVHLVGQNSAGCGMGAEYAKLDEWLSGQPVVAYFKRELSAALQATVSPFPIYPCDLLAQDAAIEHLTKEQWMSRTGGLFHLYGFSHMDRKRFHAAWQIAEASTVNALDAVERPDRPACHYLEQREHWSRYDIPRVLAAQRGFALSMALPGAGIKTFRDGEACNGTVPVFSDVGMLRAMPWTEENAILLPTENGEIKIVEALTILRRALEDREALFPKAVAATGQCFRYQATDYVGEHINRRIAEHL